MKAGVGIITLAALASATVANQKRQAGSLPAPSSTLDRQSLLSILATALPTSLVDEAITNSAAVASQISSEFAAGQTPAWFSALPSDVKSELISLQTVTAAPDGSFSAAPPQGSTSLSTQTYAALNSTARAPYPAGNSTARGAMGTGGLPYSTVVMTTSARVTPGGSSILGSSITGGTASIPASSISLSAMAALPTAVIGGGLAGLIGIVGVLAL